MKPTITIIGAGISGLSAAVHLHKQGFPLRILDASDRAGGRIKTDIIDGFRLDHGFQVLLTSYPESKLLLDYKKLNLQAFLPGATVLHDGGHFEIADPFRRPTALFSTIFAPLGSLKDKILTFFLKHKLLKKTVTNIFEQPQKSSFDHLVLYGFSLKMINLFYKPFFSGIFLENDLKTPNRMFDFVMKMFSEGDAALPKMGMEEIPKQLVSQLPQDIFMFNTKVLDIKNQIILTANGQEFKSDVILLATEANSLVARKKSTTELNSHSVTCVYFQAEIAPSKKAIVILNAATKRVYVNNITVVSNVSDQYAPANKVLICVSCNGLLDFDDKTLTEKIKNELHFWFPKNIDGWKHLKTYKIKYALPNLDVLKDNLMPADLKIENNLYCCGDHLSNGSINAALKSGRLVADLIANEYSKI